jgi:hypothetical protein
MFTKFDIGVFKTKFIVRIYFWLASTQKKSKAILLLLLSGFTAWTETTLPLLFIKTKPPKNLTLNELILFQKTARRVTKGLCDLTCEYH